MTSSRRYRPEIDGLRALSILLVLLFHLNAGVFPAGYVGVDIFFVISGYLITRNIVDELAEGQFSLALFYVRRIRRLFPALFFTVVATFFASAIWFSPEALRDEARYAIAATLSVSNIAFWRDAHQYFSANEGFIPLLHTWSLSVEEQYYVIWSLTLLSIARLANVRMILWTVVLTGIASLALSQWWVSFDRTAAFYLMPSRIFELCIGAGCIWLERRAPLTHWVSEIALALGLAAVVGAALVLSAQTPFPGFYAVIPCVGAAAVIVAGTRATIGSRALNNFAAVGIGKISYSLYLCHWPIFVFSRFVLGPPSSVFAELGLFGAAFAGATFMYYVVEKPFRFHSAHQTEASLTRVLFWVTVASVPLLLLAASALPDSNRGWPWRLSAEQQKLTYLQSFGYSPCPLQPGLCSFGKKDGPVGVEVIGDSHAQHLVSVLEPLLAKQGLSGKIYAAGACVVLAGLHTIDRGKFGLECRTVRDNIRSDFAQDRTPLIISEAWLSYDSRSLVNDSNQQIQQTIGPPITAYEAALEKTYKLLGGDQRRVMIVGPQVSHGCEIEKFRLQPGPLPHAASPHCAPWPLREIEDSQREFNDMLRRFQLTHPKTVSILLPKDYLCERDACPISANGLWLYQDGAHLTVAGAHLLSQRAKVPLLHFLKDPLEH